MQNRRQIPESQPRIIAIAVVIEMHGAAEYDILDRGPQSPGNILEFNLRIPFAIVSVLGPSVFHYAGLWE